MPPPSPDKRVEDELIELGLDTPAPPLPQQPVMQQAPLDPRDLQAPPMSQMPALPPAPPAKVIERPHPLTGMARSGIALVAGGYFIIRELLEDSSSLGPRALFIGGGLLAVALIAGISGIFTWRTTTFVADDDEFRVEKRFLSQTSTRVDYTKVQSVEVAQPLIARLMGLAKVQIDVGGAGGVALAFLSLGRAEALRDHLVARMRQARTPGAVPQPIPADGAPTAGEATVGAAFPEPEPAEELVVAVPATNLLLGALVSWGTATTVLVGLVFVFIAFIVQTPATMIPAAVAIVAFVWNRTGRNWGFRMVKTDDALRLTRGALSTTSQGLRPGRIQGVAIKQDLLQRLTGLHQMTVTVLGYGDPTGNENSETNAVVLPYGTWDEVLTVLRAIWPDVDLTQVQPHPQPRRARWLTPFTFHTHTWGIGEEVVVTQHGLFDRVISIVPHRRMQSASIHQGPLQRMLKVARVNIHTTDGPVNQRLYHLDEAVARNVFEEQVARARAAREAA